jgi:uncharacterized protein (DUF1778 family)
MANQPSPDRKAVTWRLHRDLVAAVQAAAASRGETVLAFVTRALQLEVARTDRDHRRTTSATPAPIPTN